MRKQIIILALTVAVIFPSADSRSEITRQKRQEIADRLYDIELSGGDHLGYCSEILQHLEKSANIRPVKYKSNSFDDIDRLNLRGRDVDMYSLISGGLAIRESLQLESIRPSDEGMRDINPADIKPPEIESRPFEKMRGNRNYRIYPSDKYTPEDFYYIHFNNAEKAFIFFNFINETGGAIHKRFSPASVDFMVKEKLLTQLALRESPEFSAFYTNAISDIVITGSDTFIIEGSDITLIIRPAQAQIFNQGISGMRRYTKDRYSAREKEIIISGYKGSHIYTDDRRVWSVFLTLSDGTAIISNSIKAAEKVADTFSGKSPALSDAQDYRYMRSIYPAGKTNEDGFIYLSEKFIRHIVSPQLRIKEARRMYESMKISVLEKYMIFHYQLTGKLPLSIEEVMDSAGGPSLTDPRKKELDSIKSSVYYNRAMKLEQEDLSNWNSFKAALSASAVKTKSKSKKKKQKSYGSEDFIYDLKLFYKKITGEQAYTPAEVLGIIESVSKPGGLDSKRFNGLTIIPDSFSAKSDLYGKTNFMMPLIEIETGKISKREAEEYRKFTQSYNSLWKDYSDPVGIRIKSGPSLTIETFILPLVNNPVYALLSGISGGTPIDLHPDSKVKGDTLSMAVKINPLAISSYLTLSGLADSNSAKINPADIFTGEVQFHMNDALPPADFDPAVITEFFTDNVIRSSEVLTGFLAWSLFHPVRIALPVKKPKEGMILVNSVINKLVERSNFNNFVQNESYQFSYNKTDIRVVKLTFFSSLITRIYIAEKDNVLHIATTEKYMRDILDVKPAAKPDSDRRNAVIVYRPSEMILEKDVYRTGMLENGLQKSRRNFGTVKLMGSIFPDADSKDLPDLAYRNFGFKPACPLGGDYIYDKRTGDVRNSVYGSESFPILRLDESSSGIIPQYLKKFFKSTEFRVELEFTPEGIKTKIVCK
jgi:hypothetical protein